VGFSAVIIFALEKLMIQKLMIRQGVMRLGDQIMRTS
jgi:hypothetical protein